MVRVLEDKAFLPGDYVVRVGEVADEMYFISKGEVSVLVPKDRSKAEVEEAIQLPLRTANMWSSGPQTLACKHVELCFRGRSFKIDAFASKMVP